MVVSLKLTNRHLVRRPSSAISHIYPAQLHLELMSLKYKFPYEEAADINSFRASISLHPRQGHLLGELDHYQGPANPYCQRDCRRVAQLAL